MVELILKYVDQKCIDCGTSSNLDFYKSYTPLLVVCITGTLSIMRVLLRNKADVNKCDCMIVTIVCSNKAWACGCCQMLTKFCCRCQFA